MNTLRKFLLCGLLCAFIFSAELQGDVSLNPFSRRIKRERMPIEEQDAHAAQIIAKATAAQNKNRNLTAKRHYKKIWKKYPESEQAPIALLETGKILANSGKWKKAYPIYQKIINRYPDYPEFNEVIQKQYEIATTLMDGSGPRFLHIFKIKNYPGAIGGFELVVRNAPYHNLAPQALMNVALMHQDKKHKYQATYALDRLIDNYPYDELAPDSYLKLAEIFSSDVKGPAYDQGPTREAINYYKDFLILYPDSADVGIGEQGLDKMNEVYAKSKLQRGYFYYKYRKNYPAANVFFNEAITVSPGSSSAQKARQYLDKIDSLPREELVQKSKRRRLPGFKPKKKLERPTIQTELLTKEQSAANPGEEEKND